MTTEPAARPAGRPLSGLEWRLLLTAGLASTYLVAWFALQETLPPAPPTQQPVAAVGADATDVWLLERPHPVADRPRSRAGTTRVPLATNPRAPRAPRPGPIARSRTPRVRTRSS